MKKRKIPKDTTEYLLSSEANKKMLEQSFYEYSIGKVVTKNLDDLNLSIKNKIKNKISSKK